MKKRGVTLMELLVVLAVILILSALAIPVILKAYRELRNPAPYVQLQGFIQRTKVAAVSDHAQYAIVQNGNTFTSTLILDGTGTAQNKVLESINLPNGTAVVQNFQLQSPPAEPENAPLSFAFMEDGTTTVQTHNPADDTDAGPVFRWFNGSVIFTVTTTGQSRPAVIYVSQGGKLLCDSKLP